MRAYSDTMASPRPEPCLSASPALPCAQRCSSCSRCATSIAPGTVTDDTTPTFNGTGEPGVELGIRLHGVDLLQFHLTVGPGQIENSVGKMAIPILFHQTQGQFAAVGHTGDNIDDD